MVVYGNFHSHTATHPAAKRVLYTLSEREFVALCFSPTFTPAFCSLSPGWVRGSLIIPRGAWFWQRHAGYQLKAENIGVGVYNALGESADTMALRSVLPLRPSTTHKSALFVAQNVLQLKKICIIIIDTQNFQYLYSFMCMKSTRTCL